MYLPAIFNENNTAILQNFIVEHGFAIMVSSHHGQAFANHFPLLIERGQGALGTLVGHMARANPHWRQLAPEQEILVIFHGPHTYISPSWYNERLSVPTWNYVAVHAYGIFQLIPDDKLYALLQKTVNTFETGSKNPYGLDLPDDYLNKMMEKIVGFEIAISRLEGKFKLSQNRSSVDQKNVIAALHQRNGCHDQEIAALMYENIQGENPR